MAFASSEAARKAVQARWARTTPEQRQEIAQRLAEARAASDPIKAAAQKVVAAWPELTGEQLAELRRVFAPVAGQLVKGGEAA